MLGYLALIIVAVGFFATIMILLASQTKQLNEMAEKRKKESTPKNEAVKTNLSKSSPSSQKSIASPPKQPSTRNNKNDDFITNPLYTTHVINDISAEDDRSVRSESNQNLVRTHDDDSSRSHSHHSHHSHSSHTSSPSYDDDSSRSSYSSSHDSSSHSYDSGSSSSSSFD